MPASSRVVGSLDAGRVVEERDNPLAATIGSVVENLPVAAGHVHRFQNTEVAPVFDSPAPVSRCFVQVDDDFIQPILRIDFAVNLADEFLVGTSNGEFVPFGEGLSSLNGDARDHSDNWHIADSLWHIDGTKKLYAISHML